MPFPGTRVIHPDWSQHHRPTATGTLTAECTVTRKGGGGTTDPDGTWNPDPATTLYTGPCRVLALPTNERLMVIGDTQETLRRYQVSLRHDVDDVGIGDLVHITAAKDQGLVGKQLRVVDISYGSEEWQRDLIADELED